LAKKKHAKKKFNFKALWITLSLIFVVLVGAAYAYAVHYFTTHFGFNTEINGVDYSFKTVEKVEKAIEEQVYSYEILVKGRDGFEATITGKEVGMYCLPDDQVKKIFEQQNPFLWFLPLFGRDSIVTTTNKPRVRFEFVGVVEKLDALGLFNEKTRVLPVDAYIVFQDSRYVIVPEIMGNTLNQGRASMLLKEAMLSFATEFDFEQEDCYILPKLFSTDAEMNHTIDTWNKYACFYIIYTFGDGWTEALTPTVALNWVDIAEDGTGTLNDVRLRDWLREFGKKYDTIGKERTFVTATGEVATVEGGTYGWEVDEKAEFEAIKYAYYNHIGETRDPIYVRKGASLGAPGTPDWGNSYIELDLTNQHMYYFQDGEIVFDCPVVTGSLWNGKTSTPEGVWYILEKKSPTILLGQIMPDGEREYEAPVSYWMAMTWEGHGFHDATWQPWFGGNRYTYAGSHGCINMPLDSARKLYSLVSVGTPVVSHF